MGPGQWAGTQGFRLAHTCPPLGNQMPRAASGWSARDIRPRGQSLGAVVEVEAFREDRLVCAYAAAPKAAAVMLDGGRVQTRAEDSGPGVQDPKWRETKVACCLSL